MTPNYFLPFFVFSPRKVVVVLLFIYVFSFVCIIAMIMEVILFASYFKEGGSNIRKKKTRRNCKISINVRSDCEQKRLTKKRTFSKIILYLFFVNVISSYQYFSHWFYSSWAYIHIQICAKESFFYHFHKSIVLKIRWNLDTFSKESSK